MKQRIKLIFHFAKPHKWIFFALFICIILTTSSNAVYPYIFGMLVDEVFYSKDMSAFLNIVLIYAVVYLFNTLMNLALNMSWARLMTKFLFDIRAAIFNKVLSYKGEKLTSIYSGDIISRMNNDATEFMNFIHWNVFYTIGGMLDILLSLVFIFYINIWIGIFTIILTPIIVYSSRKFSKIAKKYYEEIAKKNGFLSSWLFEIINGMQDIKLLNASKKILSDYVGKTVKIMRLQIKSGKVEVISERVNSGISILAQMILYTVSAIFIINGHLTVGGFTACVTYFGTCTSIFNSLNSKIVNISSNMVSIDRVSNILQEPDEQYNFDVPDITIEKGDILFSDVWFNYINEIPVLKGITLNIIAGERISLVGHSGAGKTTIANLLYKLYDIERGEISIDGINISDFNLHNLRSQIGVVHQETIFFDDTVRFNLCFSNNNENDEKLWQALKMSHLYDFIKSLPDGLDTHIGSGGISFSGGQKQRLAIARIFFKNPKILIFDEATSSLDNEAETVITSCWDELSKDRTMLIIAHRLSTILNSDKVAVVSNGTIVGYASHHDLIKSCPEYIELFKEQYSHSEVTVNA
jgi:ABC-type multidrug transport system fused ATPase/permease subunit